MTVPADPNSERYMLRPLSDPAARELAGVDVRALDGETFKKIEDAFNACGIIVIRGQELGPEDLLAFSERFGQVETHVRQEYALEGFPQIHVISNIKEGEASIGSAYAGDAWHSDLCFVKCPSRMSILYALEIPHDENSAPVGDTLFASAADAYDDLDAETRNFISDKRGIMQYHRRQELKARERKNDHPRPPLTEKQKAQTPDITQPMVRTHPVTGAKSLYVNETYTFGIDGMDEEEAKLILQRLYDHITAPERVYRHKWKVGDLVMWDNALMQHKAVTNYKLPQRRKLIRTSISGTEVF